jgi:hypothetical protein
MIAMTLSTLVLVSSLAQVPNPAPAINAAKNAKTQTETAQKKNADALTPAAAQAPAGQPAPAAQPPAGQPPAEQPPAGAGYTYDPAGRRDPFVTLLGRGGDAPAPGAVRPQGLAGTLIGEVTVKGVMKTTRGDFVAVLQAADGRSYIARTGDKVMDGSLKTITTVEVVFTQDVNDPLSLVKQREVRKAIRPEVR